MDFGEPHCYFEEPPLRLLKHPMALAHGWVRLPEAPTNAFLRLGGVPMYIRFTPRPDVQQTYPGEWCRSFKLMIDAVRWRDQILDLQLDWQFVADAEVWESGVLHFQPGLMEHAAALDPGPFEREAHTHVALYENAPLAWLDTPKDRVLGALNHLHGWVRLEHEHDPWEFLIDGKPTDPEIYRRPDVEQDLLEQRHLHGKIKAFNARLDLDDYPEAKSLDWSIRIAGAEVLGGRFAVQRNGA